MAYSNAHVAAAVPKVGGGILYAPKGTALPTDATTALNAAAKPLGLIGEDGLTASGEGASVTELRDWSGEVQASVTENKSITRFDFTLLGIFDPDVNRFVFGTGNVTVTAATTTAGTKLAIMEKGEEIAECVLFFEMLHKGKKLRYVAPNASPVVTAELPYTRTSLGGYTISATMLPDSNGVRTYRYLDNDDLVPA